MLKKLQKKINLPKSIWILGFVSLFMDVSSEMIHSLLPLFLVTGLGASVLSVGIIEGIAESTALIIKIFSGFLSDYFKNRKWLTVMGYGLGALSKPLFAIATSINMVFSARVLDRIGKGIRGAPRDALIADLTVIQNRGAAYGLRQSLDTLGALIGPLIAFGLMILWSNNFRAIFWVAMIPGLFAVLLLVIGIKEPPKLQSATGSTKAKKTMIQFNHISELGSSFWWIVIIGAVFNMARFSEAFLVLKAQQVGIEMAMVPLVMVLMNLIYSGVAYPAGKIADQKGYHRVLIAGLLVLILADSLLAQNQGYVLLLSGVALWGLHMGMTQGLLASMIATEAPQHLRGTCFGVYNLISGLALLISSILAGFIWDKFGSEYVFYIGALWTVIALALLVVKKQVIMFV